MTTPAERTVWPQEASLPPRQPNDIPDPVPPPEPRPDTVPQPMPDPYPIPEQDPNLPQPGQITPPIY